MNTQVDTQVVVVKEQDIPAQAFPQVGIRRVAEATSSHGR